MRARLGRHRFWVTLSVVLLLCRAAAALPRYGPIELSGNISAQQLIRHPDVDQFSIVQQRNTLKLRLDYSLLDRGRLNLPPLLSAGGVVIGGLSFIEQARLFVLYRAAYDSVYDFTPGFAQNNIYGVRNGLRLDQIPADGRDALKLENKLREAYVDLTFKNFPLNLRLGRQQIVWGETDNFRLLDRVNALDLSWHLQQESWDELRMPYWMVKGLIDLDRLAFLRPLSNTFVEFYWNPGDWYPAKRDFLPRPWSVPTQNPIPFLADVFHVLGRTNVRPVLFHGTQLFRQGDYVRNPIENSQVGVRFGAVTPQGLQFTLNYFYQRWAGDDGTNAAAVRAVLDPVEANAALARGELPIEAIAPYVHVAGISLNYADEEYTQAVFRMESIYEMGVPFTDAGKSYPNKGILGLALSNDVYGVSKRDMWKGMIAFDRPTWIRPLNRNSTFLVLGQFFWHYLLDNPEIRVCKDFPAEPACRGRNPLFQFSGFRGQFSTSGVTAGGTPSAFIDHVRDWEVLTTLAVTTFYRGGKLVPFLVYILDPVNSYNMEVIAMLDYFLTNNVILNLSQRYFITTSSKPVFETWGVAGINRGRSETGIRLTYQF